MKPCSWEADLTRASFSHKPVFLLRDHPSADWRLPLIRNLGGSHPFLTEGERTDDES